MDKENRENRIEQTISPLGDSWESFKTEFIPDAEELQEIELKAQLIAELINAREEKKITQRQIEQETGIKQPVIARLETGKTDPQLTTVIKILHALGKKLVITDL